MNKTDQEILDGSKVITEFNGSDYVWKPQARRKQRQIRSRLMDIAGQLFNAVSATETGKAQFSIDGVNQVLDFCEDYNEGMARDMDHIELYLKSNPSTGFSDLIDSVYMPLFNEWLKPWITEDEDDNEPKKK
jgi:hypothetical protein